MGALQITIPRWNITEMNGYEPITTFWQDFSIADKFGNNAIADIYRRAKSEWKDNYKYWTELCLVLNHKIWQWHERDNQRAILYDKLWREADATTAEWSNEEQEYYFEITDSINQWGDWRDLPAKNNEYDYPRTDTESNGHCPRKRLEHKR